jgi:hypothetical protein
MNREVIYIAEGRNPKEKHIIRLNESIGMILERLGAKVVNSTYMLSEGIPTEAYGYYKFSGLGIVTTFLKFNSSECNLSVNFLGFEGQIESYNNLKMYIEDTLKKVLLY